MYVGTLSVFGAKLYRTKDGLNFRQVFDGGNGFIGNTALMDLYVYKDKLYLGTQNFFVGAALMVNTDEEGLEFGFIFQEGNGNPNNTYVWFMQQYNNRLYIGTYKSGPEGVGFDLYSAETPGDDQLVIETNDAFGNPGIYGVRSMIEYDGSLILGSATDDLDKGCLIFEGVPSDDIANKNVSRLIKHTALDEKDGNEMNEEEYKEKLNAILDGDYDIDERNKLLFSFIMNK